MSFARNGPRAGRGRLKRGTAVTANIQTILNGMIHVTNALMPISQKSWTAGSRERRKKMKLTLEQKVFIEYGKARKALEIAKKQLAKEMRRYSSWHQARDYNNIDILIRDVWRKRAAYRTWVRVPMNERFCDNCAHEGTHPDSTPCSECFRFSFPQAYEEFDNWEPRKENEN